MQKKYCSTGKITGYEFDLNSTDLIFTFSSHIYFSEVNTDQDKVDFSDKSLFFNNNKDNSIEVVGVKHADKFVIKDLDTKFNGVCHLISNAYNNGKLVSIWCEIDKANLDGKYKVSKVSFEEGK